MSTVRAVASSPALTLARPAYAPIVPGAAETLVALGLTVAAAVAGGAAARGLSERLAAAGRLARGG